MIFFISLTFGVLELNELERLKDAIDKNIFIAVVHKELAIVRNTFRCIH